MENAWHAAGQTGPMNYAFYASQLEGHEMNRSLADLLKIVGLVTVFALLISCLGICAMALNNTQARLITLLSTFPIPAFFTADTSSARVALSLWETRPTLSYVSGLSRSLSFGIDTATAWTSSYPLMANHVARSYLTIPLNS